MPSISLCREPVACAGRAGPWRRTPGGRCAVARVPPRPGRVHPATPPDSYAGLFWQALSAYTTATSQAPYHSPVRARCHLTQIIPKAGTPWSAQLPPATHITESGTGAPRTPQNVRNHSFRPDACGSWAYRRGVMPAHPAGNPRYPFGRAPSLQSAGREDLARLFPAPERTHRPAPASSRSDVPITKLRPLTTLILRPAPPGSMRADGCAQSCRGQRGGTGLGAEMSDPRGTFEQTSKSDWTSERI